MIIVKISGGFGNQLFQYAAGKSLAEHHCTELKLDLTAYNKTQKRKYELDRLNITATPATTKEIDVFTLDKYPNCVRSFIGRLQERKPYYLRKIYQEQYFYFDPNFFRAPANVYLAGYWQSEKYFKNIDSVIRNEFKIVVPPKGKNVEMINTIQNENAVSLHVRRGDYAENTRTRDFHGLCSMDYYHRACEKLGRTIAAPHFFVFSDDMAWVRANLRISGSVTFVGHNNIETAFEDFRLMCRCKYHILANSSFSWWAAWLCENRKKIVIAPQKWFNHNDLDTKDLFPEGWSTI